MASEPSQPLTPADCDLSGFDFMPLDITRLLKSNTWISAASTPFLGHALICLWAESWRQIPAASLPDNDQVLQRFSMVEGKWPKVRALALSDWVKCSDGRLYHAVVAEKAIEAWLEKLAQRISSGNGNAKRWKTTFDAAPIEAQMLYARSLLAALNPASRALTKRKAPGIQSASHQHPDGIASGVPSGSQETGTGNYSIPNGIGGKPPGLDPKDYIWTQGVPMLIAAGCPERNARSMLGGLIKAHGDVAVCNAIVECISLRPIEPVGWLQHHLKPSVGPAKSKATSHTGFADKNYREGVSEDGTIV